jgi:hypothetical protein
MLSFGMQAGQVFDDIEAVIMAVNETPEYQEEIIDGFIDQMLGRQKRRFAMWRTTAILLAVGILGTLFIDRLISLLSPSYGSRSLPPG